MLSVPVTEVRVGGLSFAGSSSAGGMAGELSFAGDDGDKTTGVEDASMAVVVVVATAVPSPTVGNRAGAPAGPPPRGAPAATDPDDRRLLSSDGW